MPTDTSSASAVPTVNKKRLALTLTVFATVVGFYMSWGSISRSYSNAMQQARDAAIYAVAQENKTVYAAVERELIKHCGALGFECQGQLLGKAYTRRLGLLLLLAYLEIPVTIAMATALSFAVVYGLPQIFRLAGRGFRAWWKWVCDR